MYEYKLAKYMYLMNAGVLPKELMKMFTMNNEIYNHNTRHKHNPHIQFRRTNIASKILRHQGPLVQTSITNKITKND